MMMHKGTKWFPTCFFLVIGLLIHKSFATTNSTSIQPSNSTTGGNTSVTASYGIVNTSFPSSLGNNTSNSNSTSPIPPLTSNTNTSSSSAGNTSTLSGASAIGSGTSPGVSGTASTVTGNSSGTSGASMIGSGSASTGIGIASATAGASLTGTGANLIAGSGTTPGVSGTASIVAGISLATSGASMNGSGSASTGTGIASATAGASLTGSGASSIAGLGTTTAVKGTAPTGSSTATTVSGSSMAGSGSASTGSATASPDAGAGSTSTVTRSTGTETVSTRTGIGSTGTGTFSTGSVSTGLTNSPYNSTILAKPVIQAISIRFTSIEYSDALCTVGTKLFNQLADKVKQAIDLMGAQSMPHSYVTNSSTMYACYQGSVITNTTFSTTSSNGAQILADNIVAAGPNGSFPNMTVDVTSVRAAVAPNSKKISKGNLADVTVVALTIRYLWKVTLPAFAAILSVVIVFLLCTAGDDAILCRICKAKKDDFEDDP